MWTTVTRTRQSRNSARIVPTDALRGGKGSRFEGGTRIPFIVHWPTRVKPGVSDALVSQVDLLRSFAKLTGADLGPGAGPDSKNVLPALLGESKKGRQLLVEHANGLSLRDGTWKYIVPAKGVKVAPNTNTATGVDPEPQLYDLSVDPGEMKNLAAQQPAKLKQMAETLEKIRAATLPN